MFIPADKCILAIIEHWKCGHACADDPQIALRVLCHKIAKET